MSAIKILFCILIIPSINSLYAQTGNSFEKNIPKAMILIPGGTFTMGIDHNDLEELAEMGRKVPHMTLSHAESWFGDERPRHIVNIDSFLMDTYEVTNQEFEKFIKHSGYQAEGDWKKYAGENRLDHPVVSVTWNDAHAYAKWAGKRLPTEAEWEYAAKGGMNVKWFSWGNTPDPERANWRHQGESFFDGLWRLCFGRNINTTPVGSYKPNGYGLYDMCGNVREWCKDTYQAYPGLKEEDWKFTRYRPFDNKEGVEQRKVSRGGSWDTSNPVWIRITDRKGLQPDYQAYVQGFRCAKSLK